LHFAVSSKHRQTRRYVHTLETTLKELKELFHPISDVKVREEDHRTSLMDVQTASPIANNYGGMFGDENGSFDLAHVPPLPNIENPNAKSKYFAPLIKRESLLKMMGKIGIPVDLNSPSPSPSASPEAPDSQHRKTAA
jgi:hypothetical protein